MPIAAQVIEMMGTQLGPDNGPAAMRYAAQVPPDLVVAGRGSHRHRGAVSPPRQPPPRHERLSADALPPAAHRSEHPPHTTPGEGG